MIRPSRLVLAAALVISAGCTGRTPTAPEGPNSMARDAAPSFDETDECRSGWSNPNGKTCP
jgi:hypothetical protein